MEEFFAALFLSRIPGVGAAKFKHLIDEWKKPSIALDKVRDDEAIKARYPDKSGLDEKVRLAIDLIKENQLHFSYYGGLNYPKLLAKLTEPPPVLFSYRDIVPDRKVAVVGARKASGCVLEIVKQLVTRLVEQKICIVSGGAKGVDTLAHQFTVDCGGKTIAVMGTGVDVNYPKENTELFNHLRIKQNIVSELLPGTLPYKSFFPTRNRIIAGLSEAVFVIQASAKSGSMISARWAQKIGRPVYVVKPISSEKSLWAGNEILIKSGGIPVDFEKPNWFKELSGLL